MHTRVFVSVMKIASQLIWLFICASCRNNLENTVSRNIPTHVFRKITTPRVCQNAIITTVTSSQLSCLTSCNATCKAVTFKQDSGACSLCNLLGLVSSPSLEDLQVYEKEYSGKEFIASEFKATWQNARDHCNQNFDGLASVLDGQENGLLQEAISAVFPHTPEHWIGGSKKNNSWYWETKEGDLIDFVWFNWAPSEPSNRSDETCMWVWVGFGWDDYMCDETNYFVCQRYK